MRQARLRHEVLEEQDGLSGDEGGWSLILFSSRSNRSKTYDIMFTLIAYMMSYMHAITLHISTVLSRVYIHVLVDFKLYLFINPSPCLFKFQTCMLFDAFFSARGPQKLGRSV